MVQPLRPLPPLHEGLPLGQSTMVHNEMYTTHSSGSEGGARPVRLRPSGGVSSATGPAVPVSSAAMPTQQQWGQMMAAMQQMQQMLQLQQQRLELIDTAHSASAVDAVPSPIPSYRLPSTAARNGTHNRPSFGIVHSLPAFSPSTPPAGRRGGDEDEKYDEAGGVGQVLPAAAAAAAAAAEDDGIPEKDIKLIKDVTQIIKAEPFYGDTTKDKGCTVIDFVEKVETGMNDFMRNRPQYRLLVVRTFLREGALRWVSNKLKELYEAARQQQPPRDLELYPIEWDTDLRRPFMQAYLGTDTVDVWLSKLAALKLGSGKTKTPVELESEFDSIARHIHLHMTVSSEDKGVDMMLAREYQEIIHNSEPAMFEQILLFKDAKTLKQWKVAVVDLWNARERLKATQATRKANSQTADAPLVDWQKRNNFRGKGKWGSNGTGDTRAQSVNAMGTEGQTADDSSSGEGEGQQEDSQPGTQQQQQLSAAGGAGGGSRGGSKGRGGQGGRGGGGTGAGPWSDEKSKLYREGLCFNCKKAGHISSKCTAPQQSKD